MIQERPNVMVSDRHVEDARIRVLIVIMVTERVGGNESELMTFIMLLFLMASSSGDGP